MNARLENQQYGKSRIRVMRIRRDGPTHSVKELTVAVALDGDFESSYTSGDNSKVVPTDTMKNTVHALAKDHLGRENERFALTLAQHFVKKYPQVTRATVEATERVWERLTLDGEPHPHSFSHPRGAEPFTRVSYAETGTEIESGVRDLLILKTTGSGFEGYPRCDFTTLAETSDRFFATSVTARWTYTSEPTDFDKSNQRLIEAMLKPFVNNFSPSVQATLFEMGAAALDACPEISRIHLALPNKHYLLIDLTRLGLENENEIFLPTDEPHGQIEATVTR